MRQKRPTKIPRARDKPKARTKKLESTKIDGDKAKAIIRKKRGSASPKTG